MNQFKHKKDVKCVFAALPREALEDKGMLLVSHANKAEFSYDNWPTLS